jgi:ureidoglycolate hydrolase
MNTNALEISEFTTVGFKILVPFKSWRVATLCYIDDMFPPELSRMERHVETDEVFVLLKGQATLMVGGTEAKASEIDIVPMEPLKAYNVRQGAWHGVIASRDVVILLVENVDTGAENSEYYNLSAQQKEVYRSIWKQFPDWQSYQ